MFDPARVSGQALSDASPDLMRNLLSTVINALLSADAGAEYGAEYGAASPERVNSRNGYRHRELDTQVGTIDVALPETASGQLLPGVAAGAAQAGRGRAGQRGRDLLPARRLDAADGQARAEPGHHVAVQVAGLADGW
jgi:hypothetical protein